MNKKEDLTQQQIAKALRIVGMQQIRGAWQNLYSSDLTPIEKEHLDNIYQEIKKIENLLKSRGEQE